MGLMKNIYHDEICAQTQVNTGVVPLPTVFTFVRTISGENILVTGYSQDDIDCKIDTLEHSTLIDKIIPISVFL